MHQRVIQKILLVQYHVFILNLELRTFGIYRALCVIMHWGKIWASLCTTSKILTFWIWAWFESAFGKHQEGWWSWYHSVCSPS